MTQISKDSSTLTDDALIRQFAASSSADAFGTLVERHLPTVLAAARRILGKSLAHHAEDVAQSVFILLAGRAPRWRSDVQLIGWLYQTTHYACANLKKMERRRRQREMHAMR